MRTFVFATYNDDKAAEFSAILNLPNTKFVSSAKLGLPSPVETGHTFHDNAVLKAQSATFHSGLPAIADDSGILIRGLDSGPGVKTARWIESFGSADVAFKELNDRLETERGRTAMVVCAIALSWPVEPTELFMGRVYGSIVYPPRGSNGFGFDPVFKPKFYEHTFAEMVIEDKNKISHRAIALRSLRNRLRTYGGE